MYAPDSDSTTRFIAGPFGCLIPRFQPHYSYVYLIHFNRPYKHAKHYLGSTHDLDNRLARHRAGNGARLMEVVSEAGIDFDLCRLWQCETYEEARALERKLKALHSGVKLCPVCQHKPVDSLTLLRQGHYPFDLFPSQGKRRPMAKH